MRRITENNCRQVVCLLICIGLLALGAYVAVNFDWYWSLLLLLIALPFSGWFMELSGSDKEKKNQDKLYKDQF